MGKRAAKEFPWKSEPNIQVQSFCCFNQHIADP